MLLLACTTPASLDAESDFPSWALPAMNAEIAQCDQLGLQDDFTATEVFHLTHGASLRTWKDRDSDVRMTAFDELSVRVLDSEQPAADFALEFGVIPLSPLLSTDVSPFRGRLNVYRHGQGKIELLHDSGTHLATGWEDGERLRWVTLPTDCWW